MTKKEYLMYAYKTGLLDKLDWYFSFLTIPAQDYLDGKYYLYENNAFKIKIDDDLVILEDTTDTAYKVSDYLHLKEGEIPNMNDSLDTTVGIFIANYILLIKPFYDKIRYINGPISIQAIEANIATLLRTVPKNGTNEISIDEYIKFADNAGFLTNFSRIVSLASTPKGIIAPPGLAAYKKKVIKEMKEQYGEDVFRDYTKVAEMEDKLKAYDKEFIKDDPAYGKFMSGKVVNVARAKLYLSYGAEAGFDRSGNAKLVENSLEEGWPSDPESLSRMYNASRAGSYDRGSETQKGGTAAKVVLRATNSIKIKINDCGTKRTRDFLITKNNSKLLLGRNIMVGSKVVNLSDDNINNYVGQYVKLRSPAYCAQKDSNFCSTCMGERMTKYKDGISLLVLDVSATLLDISMASMHISVIKTHVLNINDTLS